MNNRIWLLLLAVAFALGGCAGPQHRPLNPVEREQIRRIGLLTPTVPDEVAVRMVVHPGQSLGVLGLLVAAGDMHDKTADFTHALRSRGFRSGAGFEAQLRAGLAAAGYQVSTIQAPRAQANDWRSSYPLDDGRVDAYLDIWSDLIGYTAVGATTPYRPTVNLNVRLVRARDQRVLYQDRIAYNAYGDGGGAITLTAAAGYEFEAYAQLMADPAKAAEGLQLAMRATGDALARQLR